MRAVARHFSSQIELPCTVSCGQDGEFKLAGTAVSIESARLVFRIKANKRLIPRLGDYVLLNVHLPAEAGIAAKDLSARARIIDISDVMDGTRTIVLTFRRVKFTDREPSVPPLKRRASAGNWEM
jgi:hypothetical protein